MRGEKWSRRGERVNVMNVPCVIPPGVKYPLMHSILLRAELEEIQNRLANINSESNCVVEYEGKGSDYRFDMRRGKGESSSVRARDILFQKRKNLIDSIDKLYPAFRIPASLRIAFTKCTRKFYLESPNMIGLILGPRGESLKQLESQYHAKISIRGKGSTPDSKNTIEVIQPRSADEPLHALIEAETEAEIDVCVKALQQIITPVPDHENERKKAQLRQLAMYNGVLADSSLIGEEDGKSTKYPWFDESLNNNPDFDDAFDSVLSSIANPDSKSSNNEAIDKYNRFLIDLDELDISHIIPERDPPGTD